MPMFDHSRHGLPWCHGAVQISIPLKPGSKASPAVSSKPIIRGFAFIEFGSLQAAERGLQLLNSTPLLGRPVAADWALDKTMYTNAAPAVPEVPAVISQASATRGIQVITGETPEGESAAAAIVEAAEESKDEAHESGTVDHVQAEPSSDVRKGNGVKVSGDTAAISSDSDGNAEDAPPDDTDPATLALEREIAAGALPPESIEGLAEAVARLVAEFPAGATTASSEPVDRAVPELNEGDRIAARAALTRLAEDLSSGNLAARRSFAAVRTILGGSFPASLGRIEDAMARMDFPAAALEVEAIEARLGAPPSESSS